MTRIGKTVLKLLLLITLVVEPVLFSYAMAGGAGHEHGGVAVMSMEDHSGHMAMNHDMDDGDSADHHKQDGGDSGHGNCCSTPACGAALFFSFSIPAAERLSQFFAAFDVSFEGVIPPAVSKPPQPLRG